MNPLNPDSVCPTASSGYTTQYPSSEGVEDLSSKLNKVKLDPIPEASEELDEILKEMADLKLTATSGTQGKEMNRPRKSLSSIDGKTFFSISPETSPSTTTSTFARVHHSVSDFDKFVQDMAVDFGLTVRLQPTSDFSLLRDKTFQGLLDHLGMDMKKLVRSGCYSQAEEYVKELLLNTCRFLPVETVKEFPSVFACFSTLDEQEFLKIVPSEACRFLEVAQDFVLMRCVEPDSTFSTSQDVFLPAKICREQIKYGTSPALKKECLYLTSHFANKSWPELPFLPPEVAYLTNLESIDITDNQLLFLPDFLSKLPRLTVLKARGNFLSTFPSTMRGHKALSGVDLARNRFKHFPVSITFLPSLTSLEMGENMIPRIPESCSRLTQLCILSVNNNQLTSIPQGVAGLPSLGFLWANNNKIVRLPTQWSQAKRLSTLILCNNKIEHIPSSLADLPELDQLSLSGNLICEFPDSFAQSPCLKTLDLSYNRLKQIPESVGKIRNLSCLTVSHNQLTTLPESLTQSQSLSDLDASYNQIGQLPKNIGKIPRLTTLFIEMNLIKHLPGSLKQARWLRNVTISGNPVAKSSDRAPKNYQEWLQRKVDDRVGRLRADSRSKVTTDEKRDQLRRTTSAARLKPLVSTSSSEEILDKEKDLRDKKKKDVKEKSHI